MLQPYFRLLFRFRILLVIVRVNALALKRHSFCSNISCPADTPVVAVSGHKNFLASSSYTYAIVGTSSHNGRITYKRISVPKLSRNLVMTTDLLFGYYLIFIRIFQQIDWEYLHRLISSHFS